MGVFGEDAGGGGTEKHLLVNEWLSELGLSKIYNMLGKLKLHLEV